MQSTHCVITGDSAENGSFLRDNSLEYLDLSHITSNGLSIEEETKENPLGVLPYQFEPEFDNDDPGNYIGWILTRLYTQFMLGVSVHLNKTI